MSPEQSSQVFRQDRIPTTARFFSSLITQIALPPFLTPPFEALSIPLGNATLSPASLSIGPDRIVHTSLRPRLLSIHLWHLGTNNIPGSVASLAIRTASRVSGMARPIEFYQLFMLHEVDMGVNFAFCRLEFAGFFILFSFSKINMSWDWDCFLFFL